MKIKNTSKEKTSDLTNQLIEIWNWEVLFMYEYIFMISSEYVDVFEQDEADDLYEEFKLLGVKASYMLGQIQSDDFMRKKDNSLLNLFLINVFSILDSYMESFFKGFISWSSEYHRFWRESFFEHYKRLNDDGYKTRSINVSRYNYFFYNHNDIPNNEKNSYDRFKERWKQDIEREIKNQVCSHFNKYFSKIEIKGNLDFYNDLNEFNGKFRQIRNNLIHQLFTKNEQILNIEQFTRFINLSTRIVVAMIYQAKFIAIASKELYD